MNAGSCCEVYRQPSSSSDVRGVRLVKTTTSNQKLTLSCALTPLIPTPFAPRMYTPFIPTATAFVAYGCVLVRVRVYLFSCFVELSLLQVSSGRKARRQDLLRLDKRRRRRRRKVSANEACFFLGGWGQQLIGNLTSTWSPRESNFFLNPLRLLVELLVTKKHFLPMARRFASTFANEGVGAC